MTETPECTAFAGNGNGGGDGGGGDGGGTTVDIPGAVNREFGTFDMEPSTIGSLPTGWGVAHKKTAFWADNAVQTFEMELLGTAITVRATPMEYRWSFGDGNTVSTANPGSEPAAGAEPAFFHVYESTGEYQVGLDTVFTGQFRVEGGAWQEITGTAVVASDPLELTIYRYHRYLVDEDCRKNPSGPDC